MTWKLTTLWPLTQWPHMILDMGLVFYKHISSFYLLCDYEYFVKLAWFLFCIDYIVLLLTLCCAGKVTTNICPCFGVLLFFLVLVSMLFTSFSHALFTETVHFFSWVKKNLFLNLHFIWPLHFLCGWSILIILHFYCSCERLQQVKVQSHWRTLCIFATKY